MAYTALSKQPDIHDRWTSSEVMGDPDRVNNISAYSNMQDAVSVTWDGIQVVLQLERSTGYILNIYIPYFDTPEGQKIPTFLNDTRLHQLHADWDAFMEAHRIAIVPDGGIKIISISPEES